MAADAPAKQCTCSPEFDAEFGEMFHDPSGCPLATNCGGWTWEPPCGGCDRCQLDQAVYYRSLRDTPTTKENQQ